MRILRSGEGDRSKAICSKPNTTPTEKYKVEKKTPTVFKTAEIAGVAGGCLPLKWFRLLQGEGFLYNYLQFRICLGLGFFGFLFLKSIQVTQRHARHHLTNLLLPRRLSRALHLLQRSGEV